MVFCLTLFHYRLMGPMLRLATNQVSGFLGFHGMPWFTSSRNKRRLANLGLEIQPRFSSMKLSPPEVVPFASRWWVG